MNPFLISSFLFTPAVWADRDRIFYTKIDDKFSTLSDLDFLDHDSPNPSYWSVSSVPVFTLDDDDHAYTGHGDNRKYFGYSKGVMSIGSRDIIDPFKLHLNGRSLVMNIPRVCKPKDPTDCIRTKVYFLSGVEAFHSLIKPVSIYVREDEGEDEGEDKEIGLVENSHVPV